MLCCTWCPAGIISVIGISFTFINVTIQSMSNMMVRQAVNVSQVIAALDFMLPSVCAQPPSELTQGLLLAESRRHLE